MLVNSNKRSLYNLGLPGVKLNETALETVSKYDYIGITINEHLSFEAHINVAYRA